MGFIRASFLDKEFEVGFEEGERKLSNTPREDKNVETILTSRCIFMLCLLFPPSAHSLHSSPPHPSKGL